MGGWKGRPLWYDVIGKFWCNKLGDRRNKFGKAVCSMPPFFTSQWETFRTRYWKGEPAKPRSNQGNRGRRQSGGRRAPSPKRRPSPKRKASKSPRASKFQNDKELVKQFKRELEKCDPETAKDLQKQYRALAKRKENRAETFPDRFTALLQAKDEVLKSKFPRSVVNQVADTDGKWFVQNPHRIPKKGRD